MNTVFTPRRTWREVLEREKCLALPAAHDALTARLIQRAGFPAYQIGGFAMVGAQRAAPDIDLEQFGEKYAWVRHILASCPLPVLVDGDDGYGDAKNVTRTVQEYEAIGASAIFLEDQKAPARCGHMEGKVVIPPEAMAKKLKAAAAARHSKDFFILARTDAIEPNGLDDALRRGERYLAAGADGIYLEGPDSVEQLQKIGETFRGVPLAVTVLERGGKTPWLPPADFAAMGFSMVLYPTSILFRVTRALQRGLADLKAGRPLPEDDSVDMKEFLDIVEMDYWTEIEKNYQDGKPLDD